ncbi:MAG TPA: CapA family protein [Acidimicrobiia bacterium]|nr:CapA family protein [Acidimicrobiia bacterium]
MRLSGVLVVAFAGFLLGAGAFAYRQAVPATTTLAPVTTTTTVPPTTTSSSTTTSTSSTTTTTIPPKGWVTIHGVGDVNLDTSVLPGLARNGYDWAWNGLEGLFLEDDLTVVNLECAPSELGEPEPKAFSFRCDVEALPFMRLHGVEVANQANNHSMDFGQEAMLDGRRNLIKAGIAPVGAGANAAEAYAPALFSLNGWRVAVLGFGGVVPNSGWLADEDNAGMANGDDAEVMAAAVAAAKEQADIVIVTVHWGFELETTPRAEDIERAEAMIAAGADAIFGHHPHRMQPFEIVMGKPVAWSLGNFVWQTNSVAGATSGVARVLVSPEGEVTGCLIPAFIESPGHPVLTGEATCGAPS